MKSPQPAIKELQPGTDGSFEKACEYFNESRGMDRTRLQWRWEYAGLPGTPSVFIALEDESGFSGTVGVLPIVLNRDGSKELSGKIDTVLVAQKYRGKGQYKRMVNAARDRCRELGYRSLWGITSADKVYENIGFKVLSAVLESYSATLSMGEAIVELKSSGRPVSRRVLSAGKQVALALYFKLGGLVHAVDSAGRLEAVIHLPDEAGMRSIYGALLERYPGLVRPEMTDQYLRWRITENPSIVSHAVSVYENGALKAYAVATSGNGVNALITELVFLSSEAGGLCLKTLLALLCGAGFRKADYVGNVKNGLAMQVLALLRRYGFMKVNAVSFIYMPLSNELPFDIGCWHVNGLWTEGYR